MAQVRWYLNNSLLDGWQLVDQTAATAATCNCGWVVGTGSTFSSELQSNTERASTTFTGNTVPDGTLDTTLKDAFRSQYAWSGSFAAGNWTFQFAVISTVQSGAADGQIVFRILKANADGSGATEITTGQQSTTVATNVAGTDVNITATWAAPAWTITNQYIFVQVAWKRTGAGGMTTTNIRLRTGSSTTVGTTGLTADFTATPINGTSTPTLAACTVSATGLLERLGTAALTLGAVTTSATGTVVTPGGGGSPLLDGLVSFWELEEASGTRVDSHGSNDLTDHNTVTSATGKVGTAADFATGTSEYLSHASNASLQMGDIDFTICAWVKLRTAGGYQVVAKDDDAGSARDYTLDVNGLFRFYINGGGGGFVQDTSADVGVWYFVVGWHDAGANTVNLQVNNGTPASASTGGAVPDVSAAEFRIGAREYAGFEGYFDGLIDQVGLWKRVLTSDDRTALYNGGAGLAYADFGSGPTGIEGTATPTLAAATVSATGLVTAAPLTGTATPTLATITLTTDVDLEVRGTATPTLATLTLTTDADVEVRGTATPTLAAATLSGAATSAPAHTGDLTVTLAAATLSGSATSAAGHTGDLAVTLGAATLSATGTAPLTSLGTLAVTLAPATLTASGIVTTSGHLTATLAPVTVTSTATVPIVGTALVTLGAVTITSAGTVPCVGTLTQTLADCTLVGRGSQVSVSDVVITAAVAIRRGVVVQPITIHRSVAAAATITRSVSIAVER